VIDFHAEITNRKATKLGPYRLVKGYMVDFVGANLGWVVDSYGHPT